MFMLSNTQSCSLANHGTVLGMRSLQGQASHRPWCCRIPPTRKTLRSLYAPPPLRNVAPPPPVTLPFGTGKDLPGTLRAYSSRVAPCSPATLQPRLYPCVHPLIGSGTQVRSTLCVAAQIAEVDQIAIVSLPAKFRPSRGPPLPDQSSTTMTTPSSSRTRFASLRRPFVAGRLHRRCCRRPSAPS